MELYEKNENVVNLNQESEKKEYTVYDIAHELGINQKLLEKNGFVRDFSKIIYDILRDSYYNYSGFHNGKEYPNGDDYKSIMKKMYYLVYGEGMAIIPKWNKEIHDDMMISIKGRIKHFSPKEAIEYSKTTASHEESGRFHISIGEDGCFMAQRILHGGDDNVNLTNFETKLYSNHDRNKDDYIENSYNIDLVKGNYNSYNKVKDRFGYLLNIDKIDDNPNSKDLREFSFLLSDEYKKLMEQQKILLLQQSELAKRIAAIENKIVQNSINVDDTQINDMNNYKSDSFTIR